MATSGPTASRQRTRVVVVGEFRLLVETVCRSLPAGGRAVPVALERYPSLSAVREQVLRSRPHIVTLVITPYDTFYASDLVSDFVERGQEVVAVGKLGDPTMAAELLAAGAADVLDGDGLRALARLVSRPLGDRSLTAAGRRPMRVPDAMLTEDRRIRRSLARLTPAEARTLWRLMHGSSVGEIARLHTVSVETVRSHIRSLLTKLQTSSQLSAVALAWRVGWQPAPAVLVA